MINYYLLTKPGIIMGNLLTVAAGFVLGAGGLLNFWLFCATLLGLGLIIASACVFNNYIDRKIDQKMDRTKNRPLVKGSVSVQSALLFGLLLGLLGVTILFTYTNLLTTVIACIGFFVYVLLYSLWKSRTIYGTAIGSISGAIPVVVGYCAVTNRFDGGAVLLFIIMVFWQMPHFFAIAMYRFEDYVAAKIPVFPIKKGIYKTKMRMLLYIVGFIATTSLLTLFKYTGYYYLAAAMLLGSAWLVLCLKGFKSDNDQLWARRMFRLSLVVITVFCIVIPFDLVN